MIRINSKLSFPRKQKSTKTNMSSSFCGNDNFRKILSKIFISLVRFYQIIVSPILGQGKCRFYPTCSNYMIEAIAKYGVIKGLGKGFLRIIKCHPFGKTGFDPVDKSGK